MKKILLTMLYSIFILNICLAQDETDADTDINEDGNNADLFGGFKQVYPLGDEANIQFMSNYRTSNEKILFEANPIVRFSFYNDIVEKQANYSVHERRNGRVKNRHSSAYYVTVSPQWRMFVDTSLPVYMPSYRILIGTQHIWRSKKNNNFWTFSFESGHYSNGQRNSSFSELYADESAEGDAVYDTITDTTTLSRILNRRSGNFSTNLTEIFGSYRMNGKELDDNGMAKHTHVVKAGVSIFHDDFLWLLKFGGYSDNDIKLYGHFRFHLGYEYVKVLQKQWLFLKKGTWFTISENIELIQGAHASVNPWRSVTTASLYPFRNSKEFGFYASLMTGHDNYNFRFVDKGTVISGGIKFSIFPPIAIDNMAPPPSPRSN